jgi:hypothetical protein
MRLVKSGAEQERLVLVLLHELRDAEGGVAGSSSSLLLVGSHESLMPPCMFCLAARFCCLAALSCLFPLSLMGYSSTPEFSEMSQVTASS